MFLHQESIIYPYDKGAEFFGHHEILQHFNGKLYEIYIGYMKYPISNFEDI